MGQLTDLLEGLKEKGWSPAQRAIVYTEWRKLVGATLVRDPVDARNQQLLDMAARVRTHLLDIDNHAPPAPGNPDPLNLIAAVVGMDQPETSDLVEFARGVRGGGCGSVMEQEGWVNWVSMLAGDPNRYEAFFDMEMDEDDLIRVMKSDRLGMQELPASSRTGTLEEARAVLGAAFMETGFGRLDLPALDAEDPDRLFALADCLTQLTQGFQDIGGPLVRPGQGNTVFLGLDRSGSSGFMSTWSKYFIATSPQPGLSFIEVLAHECLHAHDARLPQTADQASRLSAKKASKVPRGSVTEAWRTLLADMTQTSTLAQAKGVREPAKEIDWETVAQGLPSRWADMGLPKAQLETSYGLYRTGQLTHADFRTQLIEWFAVERAPTAPFRADTLLAECAIIRRAQQGRPVWQQFTEDFDAVRKTMNKDVAKKTDEEIYGDGYFSSACEKVARSFQATAAPAKDASNPYASRWLVFPDDAEKATHTALWTKFFQHPAIQAFYAAQPSMSPKNAELPQMAGSLTMDAPAPIVSLSSRLRARSLARQEAAVMQQVEVPALALASRPRA